MEISVSRAIGFDLDVERNLLSECSLMSWAN
jgi:hypothetical protein